MSPDDELCLCFHVTRRKVVNYLRIERPRRAAELSDCFGAGTGCGWCRPYLERLFDASRRESAAGPVDDLPTRDQYAAMRSRYVRSGSGTPPPEATPIDGADPTR